MNIIEIIKRGHCNYCNCATHVDNYDGRKFFQIRNDKADINTFIIGICENCARDLKDDLITLFGVNND